MNLYRLVAGIVIFLCVAFVLTWTPDQRVEPDGKTHVRYWRMVGAEQDEGHAVASFHESQHRIVIDSTPIPWTEHEKKILTAVLSGNPPDVVSQFAPVVQWASRMALRPLDDYIEASQLDTSVFFPALIDEMRWQGRTFALPVFTASYAFFYNKSLFREVGLDPDRPPQTWDEVIAMGRQLDKYDEQGRLIRAGFLPVFSPAQGVLLGNAGTSQLMAWQLGAEYLSDDGRTVTLATPEVTTAFTWTRDFYDAYDLDTVGAFIGGLSTGEQHGFLTEKLAMMVLDMSFLGEIKKHRPQLDYGVVQTPTFEGYPTASIAGSWWLGIPRGAKHPDEAWEFIRHYVKASTLLGESLARDDALFPANRLAASDPLFQKSPFTPVFVEQMEHSHSPVVVPLAHSVFWREFYGALERTVVGTQSVENALRQAERIVQESNERAFQYDVYVRSKMSFE